MLEKVPCNNKSDRPLPNVFFSGCQRSSFFAASFSRSTRSQPSLSRSFSHDRFSHRSARMGRATSAATSTIFRIVTSIALWTIAPMIPRRCGAADGGADRRTGTRNRTRAGAATRVPVRRVRICSSGRWKVTVLRDCGPPRESLTKRRTSNTLPSPGPTGTLRSSIGIPPERRTAVGLGTA